ncbi:hypothetical protein E4U31_003170 [Claviceps sp. LM219 group G6]|nr:hypothetical protein E4U31_003170 [Claviceps sp. LM219 group G6]
MTSRTALAYKRLFQELFSCLEHQCKVQIRWQHIHQQGIIGVTLDQDAGAIQDHYLKMLIFPSAEVLDFQQLRRLATASSNGASTGYPTSVQTQRDETSSQLNRTQQEISGDRSPGHSAQREPSEEYGYGGPPSEPGDSGVSRPSSPHSTRPRPEIRSRPTLPAPTKVAGPVVPRPILPAPTKCAGLTVASRPTQPAPASTQGIGPTVIPRPTQPAAPTKAAEPTILDKIQTLTTFLGNSNVPEELRQHAQAKLKELISNL